MGKHPLEHTHQRALATPPSTNWLGYGLPWPAPDLVNERFQRLIFCLRCQLILHKVSMQFSNHPRVRVEALQTAAPKEEVEIANPPVLGRSQRIGDESFCAQMSP